MEFEHECYYFGDDLKGMDWGEGVAFSSDVWEVSISLGRRMGKVIEINRQTLKLVDLTKVRLKVKVKENAVIPMIVRVSNGDWPFQHR